MISTIFIVVVSGIGLIILSIVAVWFYYAYTRPTTPSGRWLIEVWYQNVLHNGFTLNIQKSTHKTILKVWKSLLPGSDL